MTKKHAVSLMILFVLAIFGYSNQQIFLVSIVALLIALVLGMIFFERKDQSSASLVLIATLSAVTAVSRIPFAPLPSVQPMTFFILMTSLSFGRSYACLVALMSTILSNMALGQGPWTLWQMLAWSLVALLAHPALREHRVFLLAYGFLVGLVFGWIMNIWVALASGKEAFFATWLLACVSSLPMDIAHAVSNAVLIYFFQDSVQNIFIRIRRKYRL